MPVPISYLQWKIISLFGYPNFYRGSTSLDVFKRSIQLVILASFFSVTSTVMFHVGVRCRATVSAIL